MAKVLEICVDSLAAARAAIAGGADRLELCSALAVGGLTPYRELLMQIRRESDIPIRCLMRPRAGDFLYTQEELTRKAHNYELSPCGSTVLCLDARQNGIGSNSCGPRLPEMYKFKDREFDFKFELNV